MTIRRRCTEWSCKDGRKCLEHLRFDVMWRGKRYRIHRVLGRWREAGGWWHADDDADRPWLSGDAREIVRIDAISVTSGRGSGTYEIARDLRNGSWTLFRVLD